jgi:streptogramin lyase
VDSLDRVWLTTNQAEPGSHAAQRYDPTTGTWDVAMQAGVQGYSGIQEGQDGLMWLNYGFGGEIGLRSIDRDTLVVGPGVPIPGAVSWLNGVSIDPDGNVWTVSPGANAVFRYDPATGAIDSYNAACGSPTG